MIAEELQRSLTTGERRFFRADPHGALRLAQAGLLDGLEATTHHGAIDLLRAVAPKTTVVALFYASVTMPGSWTWESLHSLPGGHFGRQEGA